MNGVLPAVTWGTWDDFVAPCGDAEAHASGTSTANTPDAIGKSERSQKKLERKGLRAPKQSQLWFEEVLDRVDATPFGQQHSGYHCNPLHCLHEETQRTGTEVIPWESLPEGIHPRDGKLPPERIRKKRHQVENLAVFLQRLLRPGDVVVEFCAGSGYVALPLACMFHDCTFVILDKKEPSLAIAEERIAAAKLTNVEVFCGFIDDYNKRFDVGIALHACGEATDMVMQKCLESDAAFVLAPCCVGKIKLSALSYPRSQTLEEVVARNEYEVLARAADFGHTNDAVMSRTPVNLRRRRCKTLLESDRNMRAVEAGYTTFKFVMHPHDATPKNDVLVGLPPVDTTGEPKQRTLRLECTRALSHEETYRAIFGAP
ncbi:hypothetical protein Poli38472_005098 [Pythium oligandrum]|uniref:Methyltransferase domain-containing protein n=1 Tax=Pythium oligandrum TaxID=41045 RepID=A0A8K1CGV7_PYTOL|nr:hypothetical protein Poli38472_005098 [Pythium oligandrum]|eukprot:TMW62480.1 hypothetical protein Poli38472_005098 [Pythium oligandrum]